MGSGLYSMLNWKQDPPEVSFDYTLSLYNGMVLSLATYDVINSTM